MSTNTNDIHALSGAYALDALDELERTRFEHHLASCETCQTEVASFRATTAALAMTEPIAPSPELRDAVLTTVDRTRQVSRVEHRMARNLPRLASVAAGIMAAALVGVSAVAVGLSDRVGELEAAAPLAEIVTAEDATFVTATLADGGEVRVIAAPSAGTGVVLADDLPSLSAEQVYQLWLLDDSGGAVPAGLLDLDGEGDGDETMQGDMTGVVAIGVTVEPAGGSDAPTSDPVAVVQL